MIQPNLNLKMLVNDLFMNGQTGSCGWLSMNQNLKHTQLNEYENHIEFIHFNTVICVIKKREKPINQLSSKKYPKFSLTKNSYID